MRFTKLLCPIDFSETSYRALEAAKQLARDNDAELVLAHVWHPPPYVYGAEPPISSHVIQDLIDDATRKLQSVERETSKTTGKLSTRFLTGVPWDQIVGCARAEAVDLIVIGTHGRTGIKHVLLGSVAEQVVRHAGCAVLVVR
jgi:universal stress protein A